MFSLKLLLSQLECLRHRADELVSVYMAMCDVTYYKHKSRPMIPLQNVQDCSICYGCVYT